MEEEFTQENEMQSCNEEIVCLDDMEEVVVVEQAENTTQYPEDLDYRHRNRLPGAIVSTVLVAGPIGIAGIIYAAKSNIANKDGRLAEASFLNKRAKKWIRIGLWLGIAFWVLFVILYIVFLVNVMDLTDLY